MDTDAEDQEPQQQTGRWKFASKDRDLGSKKAGELAEKTFTEAAVGTIKNFVMGVVAPGAGGSVAAVINRHATKEAPPTNTVPPPNVEMKPPSP